MKKFKFLIYFLLILAFTSCFSTPTEKKAPEAMIYFYTNPSSEFIEYESISLGANSALAIYSVDRNNALMMLEMGSYSIVDGVITINAGKFQAIGTFTDEKIVIGEKEFIRS